MKIDRTKKVACLSEEGRAQQVHRILEGRKIETAKERNLSVHEIVTEQRGPKM